MTFKSSFLVLVLALIALSASNNNGHGVLLVRADEGECVTSEDGETCINHDEAAQRQTGEEPVQEQEPAQEQEQVQEQHYEEPVAENTESAEQEQEQIQQEEDVAPVVEEQAEEEQVPEPMHEEPKPVQEEPEPVHEEPEPVQQEPEPTKEDSEPVQEPEPIQEPEPAQEEPAAVLEEVVVVMEEVAEAPQKKEENNANCPSRKHVIKCAGEYLDTNGNGLLERFELQTAIDKLPWLSRGILSILGSVDKMMDKCDVDGDGAIGMGYDMENSSETCLATCFKRRAFKSAFFADCKE